MRRTNDGSYGTAYTRRSPFRTSRAELLHLTAGVLIFFLIEVSSLLRSPPIPATVLIPLLATFLGITAMAFALHELAHKFTAQHYGLWSEFRLDPLGTVISLLSAFMPFKLMAPGAVVIFGFKVTDESMGKIALAGPLANIAQVLVFTLVAQFFPLFWYAVVVNVDIAFFNLIPLSILDGQKVFTWSKKAWAAAFVTALALWIFFNR